MASVYLFFSHTMPKFKGESDVARHLRDGDTVNSEWLKQNLLVAEASLKYQEAEYAKGPEGISDEAFEARERMLCRHGLLLTFQALNRTLEWAEASHKTNQALRAETDEEGNFEFALAFGTCMLTDTQGSMTPFGAETTTP
jgi:hypothetical protein